MLDSLERLATALARRYTIERELGRGGSATIYLAFDRKHRRRVALKVLAPEIAALVGRERFQREIEIAASLAHPNILPLFDSGQAAGMLFYVMPYVEGETLRDRLRREGRLSLNDALAITRELAAALRYAHGCGVIHRDVKPENILLAAGAGHGHALLADFGVARIVRSAESELITEEGTRVGTSPYMSPEQAAGRADVDARTDLFSLGCVLYEMLAGAPLVPGSAASSAEHRADLNWRANLMRVRSDVTEEFCLVLDRMIAPSADARFESADALLAALPQPAALGSVSAGGAASGESATRRPRRSRKLPRAIAWTLSAAILAASATAAIRAIEHRPTLRRSTILVARFENKTGDATLDAIGEMAADYVARGLRASRSLDVFDVRTSVRSADTRKSPLDERALARAVGAGVVVRGRYYREQNDVQVESQIVDVSSGKMLLALDPVVGSQAQRSRIVDTLRQRVLAGIASLLGSAFDVREIQSVPPTFEAYRELRVGDEAIWHFDFTKALVHLQRAIQLDTSYLDARTLAAFVLALADDCAHADSALVDLQQKRDRFPSLDAARVDFATATCRGDTEGAFFSGRRVLSDEPRFSGFAVTMGILAEEVFRPREALEILSRLDPARDGLGPQATSVYWDFTAIAHHQLGQFRKQLDAARHGLSSAASRGHLLVHEAVALDALDRTADATRLALDWLARSPNAGSTGGSPDQMITCVALEMRAHGRIPESDVLLARAAEWTSTRPPDDWTRSDAPPCVWNLFNSLYYAQQWERARQVYERAAAKDTASVKLRGALGALAIRRGDTASARSYDDWLSAHRLTGRGQASYARARLAALRGQRERAVAFLREAFDAGLSGRMYIHTDPDLESLRQYPPYQRLVQVVR